jgi:hypothetical protein
MTGLIITGQREAAALAERLRSEGKLVAVTEAGGASRVLWVDWARPPARGRWRDSSHPGQMPR